MKETIKVEFIYLWEKYKDDLEHIGIMLLSPIWLPFALIMLFLFAPDDEADEQWCKEHNYQYPSYAGWDAHRIVKRWKKEYKKQERYKHKEQIRHRLQKKMES